MARVNRHDGRFCVILEAPDTCDGSIDVLDRLTFTFRQFADGTIDVTAVALDGTILGSLSVVAPPVKAPRYTARPSPQSGSGFWYVLDGDTGAEAEYNAAADAAAGLPGDADHLWEAAARALADVLNERDRG